MGRDDHGSGSPIFVSSREYFSEIVNDALEQRRLKTYPLVKGYLVELLEFYVPTSNLFDDIDASGRRIQETLAETFLKAQSSDTLVKIELLKKLGDRSLYIAGFFGDSLQRKLVDLDYYADMGCMAYGALADCVREDTPSRVYLEFHKRFLDFVEVLTYISSKANLLNEENIMRLYEVYAQTGSDVAREKLIEKGLIAIPVANLPSKKQQ